MFNRHSLTTHHSPLTRRGTTILEVTISLGIFALVLVAVGQSVALFAQQRRVAERRQLAANTAENLMEQVFARDWQDLTAENLSQEKLPDEVERDLPGARLAVEVADVPGPPAARRIQIEVGYRDAAGIVSRPVRLVAWRYQP